MSAVCAEAIAIARRMRPRVYLAGPIKGLACDAATRWREVARAVLLP